MTASTGHTVTNPETGEEKHYNLQGTFTGKSIPVGGPGKKIMHLDADGNEIGCSFDVGPRYHYDDPKGLRDSYTGYSNFYISGDQTEIYHYDAEGGRLGESRGDPLIVHHYEAAFE